MGSPIRAFFDRHPVLGQSVKWAVPALIVGAFVRVLLLSYLPYALWGADSRSHFSFAHQLIVRHTVSLDEKRRYLVPILLLPVSLLPGSPLRWAAILQHLMGVASLVPFAYIIRRTLVQWRWWLIPLSVLYALFPIAILFEHELVGECLLFNTFLWAFAGWVAWRSSDAPLPSGRFWYFFVPFAAFIITKPAARFVWPGVLVALGALWLGKHLKLSRWQWAALAALIAITPTVGSRKLGAFLLYSAVFPLTQLDTPRYAEYKAEIRDLVIPFRSEMDVFYLHQTEIIPFLIRPDRDATRPHWVALESKADIKAHIYIDLALEAARAHPIQVVRFGLQRLIASANASLVKLGDLGPKNVVARTEHFYRDAERSEKSPLRLAFALPSRGPVPSYGQFQHRLNPRPDSWESRLCRRILSHSSRWANLVKLPGGPMENRAITHSRPTILGCLVAVGLLLAFLPPYRATLGVWALVALSYLCGVFVFSEVNYRYFAPVWPVLIIVAVLPLDWAIDRFRGQRASGVGALAGPAIK